MKIDIWRASGVTAGAAIISAMLWSLTYPLWGVSIEAFLVKDVFLTIAIAAFFAWVYFQQVTPSTSHGFGLGLFMVAVPFALSFLGGIAAEIGGLPPLPLYPEILPEWYWNFNVVGLIPFVPVGTTAAGWYLAKK